MHNDMDVKKKNRYASYFLSMLKERDIFVAGFKMEIMMYHNLGFSYKDFSNKHFISNCEVCGRISISTKILKLELFPFYLFYYYLYTKILKLELFTQFWCFIAQI